MSIFLGDFISRLLWKYSHRGKFLIPNFRYENWKILILENSQFPTLVMENSHGKCVPRISQ